MSAGPVKVGIVGLGRWARVLTRAAARSERLEIVAGYSRSEEKRRAYEQVARAGKQVYTEKPIANTLESGLAIEALQERYGGAPE